MAAFKKHLTPLSKGGQILKHRGKGSQQGLLPGRSALNALASNPGASTPNDYAKATPSIMDAPSPAGPDGGNLASGLSPGISGG